eukprot:2181268-Amphidinium_carterae.1
MVLLRTTVQPGSSRRQRPSDASVCFGSCGRMVFIHLQPLQAVEEDDWLLPTPVQQEVQSV